MPPRVRPPLHRGPAESTSGSDAGFTVLECLVSFILLAVVGASGATAIVNATTSSATSTARTAAANLAQNDQEAAQALRYPNYPGAVAAKKVVVGTTTYTVTRTVAKTCPSTPNYDTNPYMTVTTTVTWPPGNSRSTVTMAQELAC